jgi:xanthine dehydrogenase molybdenum-binding subunit
MGGSFGGKQEFILEPVTAWLALRTGRPVRLRLDRRECMSATSTRPATRSTVRTTVTPAGLLQRVEVDSILDAGAYTTNSIDYAEAMAHKLTRLYRIPHYRHRGRVVCTNTPVAGGARGWGAPEMFTAAEIHLDLLARRLRLDPVELRLRNLVRPHDIDPSFGLSLGDARVGECLERGAAAFGWRERRAAAPGHGRHHRGVGVACGAHVNGQLGEGFTEHATMTLSMNEDGSLTLNASLHEVGCGTVTSMRLIVAEVMEVDPGLVAAGEADTALTPYDFGTYASRMTYVGGACARATATMLRKNVLEAAAELLDEPVARLRLEGGRVVVVADTARTLAYGDVAAAARSHLGRDLAATNTYVAPSNPGAYSVQFAEVEVDVATGLCRVVDVLAVGDVGRAINPAMVVGQFQGAVQMGIGYALCEDLAVDELGRVAARGLADYLLVTAPDMPDVRVLLIEHDGNDGPFGAKSVGEIATVPTAAAVVNAVNHALGTALTCLPATPDRILSALAAHGGQPCA